jgi:hypothetical protein
MTTSKEELRQQDVIFALEEKIELYKLLTKTLMIMCDKNVPDFKERVTNI